MSHTYIVKYIIFLCAILLHTRSHTNISEDTKDPKVVIANLIRNIRHFFALYLETTTFQLPALRTDKVSFKASYVI